MSDQLRTLHEMRSLGKVIVGYVLQGVVGGIAWVTLLAVVAPGSLRDIAVVTIWLTVIVGGTAIILRWLGRSAPVAPPDTSGLVVTYDGAISPKGNAQRATLPTPDDMPAEAAAILRRAHDAIDAENERWEREQKEKGRTTVAMSGEVQNRVIQAASDEAQWHRAVDTLLSWLYRRINWHDLSDEARFSEPAPASWAEPKYKELGLDGLQYQPPQTIAPESRKLSAWEMTPREAIKVAREGVRKRREGDGTNARTPLDETATIDITHEHPMFYDELTPEEQVPHRSLLCSRRAGLREQAAELDKLIVGVGVSHFTVGQELSKWLDLFKVHLAKDWNLDPRTVVRDEVRKIDVPTSQLVGPKAAQRTQLKQHLAWLEKNGAALCADQDVPESDAMPTPNSHVLAAIGGTTATCSCGWRGPGSEFEKHRT